MKTTIKIKKKLVTAPIDFGTVLTSHRACGVNLDYKEFGFLQFSSKKIVLFDAYSSAHRYGAFNVDCGVIAFPFALDCMTDGGERVAYCGLRFGEEQATEWKLCYDSTDPEIIGKLAVDPDAASTPIPSGVCAFADADGYVLYRQHINDEIHPLAGLIVLNGQTRTTVELYGKKYAVFSSGWGDGRYRCYAGLSDGRVTAIIVDFGMIEYPESSDELIDVEIETSEPYLYDPNKTEFENKIAKWTAVIDGATDSVERLKAYSRRGYAYHSAGDTERALADYEAAIAETKNVTDRPTLLRAWAVFDNAAGIYAEKSDYDSAIRIMNVALDIHDNFYAGAYVRLIDLYQLTKATDKAMEVAERMMEMRRDDPVANMKYAEVCVAAMEYARAAQAYERLASEFKLYENLFDEASCLIELGDYDSAEAALERYPAKEFSEQYWYYNAYIDMKKQKFRSALENAERSHGIDPEYMPALYLLIDIESIVQEYHAVARYAEEYKKLRPNGEYGYCVCAEAQLILGNFSECSRNYFHLYDVIKDDDKYGALAAITAEKMGDVKRKSSILRRLRRKKSPYYYGAIFAIYIKKYGARKMSLSKVINKLHTDNEFLLRLATYLNETDNVLSSAHLLRALIKEQDPSYEVVAQQIRTADKLRDDKLFNSFFEYYMSHFIGDDATDRDRAIMYERFKSMDKHGGAHYDSPLLLGKPVITERIAHSTKPNDCQ